MRNLTLSLRGILSLSVFGLAAFGLKLSSAEAYQVQVNPSTPKLGDTISVFVTPDVPNTAASINPKVSAFGKQYEAFPIGNNRYRAFVPTSPLTKAGGYTLQVSGSEPTKSVSINLGKRWFRTQYINLPPGKSNLGTDHEFDRVDAFKQIVSPKKFWNGTFARPSVGYVSTEYGVQRYYNGVFANDYYHRGVDYAAATGTPVKAPASGQIRLVGYERDGFEIHGNTIGLDHGQGVQSIFVHLHSIRVTEGQFVQKGEVIGTIGNTGASTGPHLHWGLYVNGVGVDPVPWRYDGFQ